MALAARSNTPAAGKTGKPCSIGAVYEAVADDPTELAELNVVLYQENNTQAQAFTILTQDGGFSIGFQSVNNHRGKQCRCFREKPSRFCHECRYDLPSCVCAA